MKNTEIYNTAINYNEAFAGFDSYLPAKANFILQKNMKVIQEAAQEIDSARIEIIKHYGTAQEDGTYLVPEESREVVEKELNDLLAIEQDLNIKTISIDAFGDIKFTPAQMRTIMFMIEEE